MHALVVHVVIGLFDTKTPKTMTAIKRPTETVLTATIILAEELFCKINNCLNEGICKYISINNTELDYCECTDWSYGDKCERSK